MITYHENIPTNSTDLTNLYDSVGWKAYTEHPDKMECILDRSLWYLTVRVDSELIGLVRVVGDDCSIIYIQDLLVDPRYQRQGIGAELIRRTLEQFSHVRQIVLVSDKEPAITAFYRSVGMQPIEQVGGVCFVRYAREV